MELIKIPLEKLKEMNKMGFIEITPYIHKNPFLKRLFWARLKTALNLSKLSTRVLDFGSGSGIFLPTLSKNFKKVNSIDINTTSLEYIKKEYNLENVEITKNIGTKLPYKNETFDIVFATDVLEHFKDSTEIQKEFSRVLKKEGILIISGPTENKLYVLARKFLYKREKPIDHYSNVEDVMKKSKLFFNIEKIKVLPLGIPIFKIYRAKKK